MVMKRRRWNPLAAPLETVPATAPARLFTPDALQRAWLAVKRAGGGQGVDGKTIRDFEANMAQEMAELMQELVAGTYRPRPVRRIMVPKPKGGLRAIALWALRDRVAQRVVYDIVAPCFELSFLPCNYGFRPGLGVQDALAQLIKYRDDNLRWVVDGDIKDCFDEIQVDRLVRLLRVRIEDQLLLRYIEGWLKARIFNSADGVPKQAGTSQGSVLSPLLANVYLHEIDVALTGESSQEKLAFIRYADDMVVCCRRKQDADAAFATVAAALDGLGLRLNAQKSRVLHFDEGFSWLGYFLVRRACYKL